MRGSRGKGKVSVTAEFTLNGIWRTAFDECRRGEEEIHSARRRIGRSRVRWNERLLVCGEGVETVTVRSKGCEKASKNPSVTNVREKESQKSVCGEVVSNSYTCGHEKEGNVATREKCTGCISD